MKGARSLYWPCGIRVIGAPPQGCVSLPRLANSSRGELTESRHDLGPRGECQDFPDAMNIVERERHVVSSKRGRMDAGDAASGCRDQSDEISTRMPAVHEPLRCG